MNATAILISTGAGLSIAMLVGALGHVMTSWRGRVRGRLATIADVSPYEAPVDLRRRERYSSIPFMQSLLSRRRRSRNTQLTLDRAGLPLRVGEYFMLRIALSLAGLVVGLVLGQTALPTLPPALVGAGGLAIGILLPTLYVRRRTAKRSGNVETQLVEFCDLMASMLESGFGYLQALSTTASQIGPPLSHELSRLLDSVQLGGNIDDAFEELNVRLQSRDFDMVATSIAIQRKSGGNLAEILRGVSSTIRERQAFERDVRALTSRERYTAVILAGFPFLLALALALLMPDTFGRLFTDTAGRIILGVGIVMDGIGYYAIKRVTRLEI